MLMAIGRSIQSRQRFSENFEQVIRFLENYDNLKLFSFFVLFGERNIIKQIEKNVGRALLYWKLNFPVSLDKIDKIHTVTAK